MNTSEESLNDQDPDYVSTTTNDQTQQKIYEENGKHIEVTIIFNNNFLFVHANEFLKIMRIW